MARNYLSLTTNPSKKPLNGSNLVLKIAFLGYVNIDNSETDVNSIIKTN